MAYEPEELSIEDEIEQSEMRKRFSVSFHAGVGMTSVKLIACGMATLAGWFVSAQDWMPALVLFAGSLIAAAQIPDAQDF